MCFVTSKAEISLEDYIPYYQPGIGKLEKKQRKTNTDLKNVLLAMSACIKEAEQLVQSSYDITICNSPGKAVSEIFQRIKRVQFYSLGVQKL
jgi:hypothetical protein